MADCWSRHRGRWARWSAIVPMLWAVWACSPEPRPLLSAHELIGSTPEQIIERLGEPRLNRPERGPHFGALRWADLEGVEVMVIVKGGVGSYVSYQFVAMDPFDEAAALARVDVEPPNEEPRILAGGQARRWEPCGPFARLTVSLETRLVSVGPHPWTSGGDAVDAAAGQETD